MKFWKIFLVIALLISSFSIATTTQSLSYENAAPITQVSKPIKSSLDMNIEKVDLNGDKLSDFIQWDNKIIDAIVIFDNFDSIPNTVLGIPISYSFKQIPAVNIQLPRNLVDRVASLEGVKLIEQNYKLKPYLYQSTSQLGVRTSFWDRGLTGSPQMSIAVLDSGVDISHTAFKGRVIASYNALNNNQTAPIDDVGHGTHVAGIALGAQDYSNGMINVTSRNVLPTDECVSGNCYITLDFDLPNIPAGSNQLTIEVDWARVGVDNPGTEVGIALYYVDDPNDSTACLPGCFVSVGTSGKASQTFTLKQGNYIVGFANLAGAGDQYFEATARYPIDSTLSSDTDGYPLAAGVAFSTKLVNVKVIDNNNNGDATTFDTAINWVIQNRMNYNISVVNLSLGIDAISASMDSLIAQLMDNGIIAVVAAGNDGVDAQGVYSPGSAREAITVGAVNSINELTFYSSKGTRALNGGTVKPDVVAPGGSSGTAILGFNTDNSPGYHRILSADASLGFDLQKNDLVGYEGTSMAAPHIAGLASLLAQYISTNSTWDWNSRTDALKVKRAILAGTFEIANIGVGREEPYGTNYSNNQPTIQRDGKDYHEGWGAVDARATLSILDSSIAIGFSDTLSLSLKNPYAKHVAAWTMQVQQGTPYGFLLSVPSGVDADIVLYSMDRGPVVGSDYGDLTVLASTSQGKGVNEGLGFVAEKTETIIVAVKMVNAPDGVFNLDFVVSEENDLPYVNILSPSEGQVFETTSVGVTFEGSESQADAFIDGIFVQTITSGTTIEVDEGVHTLKLEISNQAGFLASAEVTFEVKLPETSESVVTVTENPVSQLSSIPIMFNPVLLSLIIVPIIRKRKT